MTQSGTTVVLISHRAKILRRAVYMLVRRGAASTFVEAWQRLGIEISAGSMPAITPRRFAARHEQCPAAHRIPALRPVEAPYPTSCRRTLTVGWAVIGVRSGGFELGQSWRR